MLYLLGQWQDSLTGVASSCTLKAKMKNGGADGDRTRDLQRATLSLSQLSYCPKESNALGG